MRSSTNSDRSSRISETKLFGIEFSDLYISKEGSVKAGSDQLDSQLFEAEYLADLFLCQLMSPLWLTRRRRRPFGYVNSDNLRGGRIELRM
jgi:hypothetical protein